MGSGFYSLQDTTILCGLRRIRYLCHASHFIYFHLPHLPGTQLLFCHRDLISSWILVSPSPNTQTTSILHSWTPLGITWLAMGNYRRKGAGTKPNSMHSADNLKETEHSSVSGAVSQRLVGATSICASTVEIIWYKAIACTSNFRGGNSCSLVPEQSPILAKLPLADFDSLPGTHLLACLAKFSLPLYVNSLENF